MEYTSLFAENEFSEKVSEEMKLKILGNKINSNNIMNKHNKIRNNITPSYYNYSEAFEDYGLNFECCGSPIIKESIYHIH